MAWFSRALTPTALPGVGFRSRAGAGEELIQLRQEILLRLPIQHAQAAVQLLDGAHADAGDPLGLNGRGVQYEGAVLLSALVVVDLSVPGSLHGVPILRSALRVLHIVAVADSPHGGSVVVVGVDHGDLVLLVQRVGNTLDAVVETKTTSLAQIRSLKAQLSPIAVDREDDSVSRALDEMRTIKSPDEIDCLRRAQRISEDALAQAARLIHPGVSELDIMMAIGIARTRAGCEARSLDMIFTSGVDTSLPHGNPKIRNIQDGDFVMVDMGSTIGGYASDMTRTLAVGHITDRQRDVYNTVLDAQLAAPERIRPGVRCADVDRAARQVVEKSPFAEFCFGHGLGLEIHEEPRFNPTDETLLRPGMVITVEPGIYIPGAFGVRIEDMVLITQDGYKNLTRYPKELTIL